MEYPLLSFTVGMNDFVWIFHYAKIQNLVVSYLCHYKGTYYSILYVEAKEMGFALFGIDIAEFFLFCSAPRLPHERGRLTSPAAAFTTGFYQLSFVLIPKKVAKKKSRLPKNCLRGRSFGGTNELVPSTRDSNSVCF